MRFSIENHKDCTNILWFFKKNIFLKKNHKDDKDGKDIFVFSENDDFFCKDDKDGKDIYFCFFFWKRRFFCKDDKDGKDILIILLKTKKHKDGKDDKDIVIFFWKAPFFIENQKDYTDMLRFFKKKTFFWKKIIRPIRTVKIF